MKKQDFITILFNNGQGFTLNQIRKIENSMIDTVPDGLIQDLIDDNGMTEQDAIDTAIYQARDVFLEMIKDYATDMITLHDYFIENYRIGLTDMQTYSLYYAIGREN